MKDFSYITNSHPAYIESLYHDFINNPDSVDQDLRKFFEGFDFAVGNGLVNGHASDGKQPSANGKQATDVQVATDVQPATADQPSAAIQQVNLEGLQKELSVYQLIQAYRKKGHLIAKTNPIRERKDRRANLSLSNYGLTEGDLETSFHTGKVIGMPDAKLKDIIAHLQLCYTSSVGVEYSSINDPSR
jgi:2-oxoglutarate dehydrogenase E1 component